MWRSPPCCGKAELFPYPELCRLIAAPNRRTVLGLHRDAYYLEVHKHLALGIYSWYISGLAALFWMSKKGIAKLFRNGRSQAVRLPQEFRFEGQAVRVRRVAEGVLLEPLIPDTAKWFAKMDQIGGELFDRQGRRQPRAPKRRIFK